MNICDKRDALFISSIHSIQDFLEHHFICKIIEYMNEYFNEHSKFPDPELIYNKFGFIHKYEEFYDGKDYDVMFYCEFDDFAISIVCGDYEYFCQDKLTFHISYSQLCTLAYDSRSRVSSDGGSLPF